MKDDEHDASSQDASPSLGAEPHVPAAASSAGPTEQGSVADPRRWLALAVVLIGMFMAIIDVSIVNVAIPSISKDLHASFSEVEFVVAAYVLAYGALLITGGRLGDIFGRKPLFLIGLSGFTVASAVCGTAPNATVLIIARALQGVSGALVFPQVLAVIQVTFQGRELTRALGTMGAVIGIGAIAGQIVGGSLISANLFGLSWRPTFLVNLPIGVVAVVAAALVLPGAKRSQGEERPHLDLVGVVLSGAALFCLAFPLLEGRDAHWPAWMLVLLVATAPLVALFLAYERRLSQRGGMPLVNIVLFRQRAFSVGLGVSVAAFMANAGFLFMFALYIQVGLGFSPLAAAVTYSPAALGVFVMSLLSPKLVPLLGRHVLTVGYAIAALGYVACAAVVTAAGASISGWKLAPALLLVGIGSGMATTPLVGTILSGVNPRDAGGASGVIATALQVGNALGVALLPLVFFAFLGNQASAYAATYASAFGRALPVAAGLTLAACVLVWRLPTTSTQSANALIERAPGWAEALAYSLYLTSGGHVADSLFRDLLGHTIERRVRRTTAAPEEPGEFLAFHFSQAAEDQAWLNFLVREALARGDGPVPHEAERQPVIAMQVEEVRRRQVAGFIDPDLDPELVRLAAFALANYPRILRQITRMTTGLAANDPVFEKRWTAFLRQLGPRLKGRTESAAAAPPESPGRQHSEGVNAQIP
jgi:EmrB/QacA subfamily drug resistance transporter